MEGRKEREGGREGRGREGGKEEEREGERGGGREGGGREHGYLREFTFITAPEPGKILFAMKKQESETQACLCLNSTTSHGPRASQPASPGLISSTFHMSMIPKPRV